jgi:hypothetical protein
VGPLQTFDFSEITLPVGVPSSNPLAESGSVQPYTMARQTIHPKPSLPRLRDGFNEKPMFRTDDNDLAGIPGMFGEGLAHWHAVSRMLRKHWFHLTIKMVVEGRAQEFELMVNDEVKLQQVLKSQDDEVFVKVIQIVTPANMNGGDAWRMEKVESLAVGDDSDADPVCVMRVEGGSIYHDSYRSNLDVTTLTNMRTLYDRSAGQGVQ